MDYFDRLLLSFIIITFFGIILFAMFIYLARTFPDGHAIFRSKKQRVTFATREMSKILGEESKQILCKLDNQLKTHFNSKGHLHFHVFTPSGEFYVQFRFIGYSTYTSNVIKKGSVNVLPFINVHPIVQNY